MLAALGEREQPGQPNDEEKRQAKRQAIGVGVRSISVGLLTTVGVWLLVKYMNS